MNHRELLINGVFIGGPCDTSIGKGISRSPWDGIVVGTFAEAGPAEVDAAINAAHTAFTTWKQSSSVQRRALLMRIAQLVRERKEELAQLMCAEIGKPITLARAEIDRTSITFELAAQMCEIPPHGCGIPVDVSQDPRSKDYELRLQCSPRGPVLAIAPYNWPFNLAAHKIAPALAMGCTVVLKGSEKAALCTLELARIIHEAGCPAGVLNAVECSDRLAEKMVLDPRIKVVSFTGSPSVGWKIRSLVPEKHVVLELGGTAPVIVGPSAKLKEALPEIAVSGNAYAGQVCISAQNVFVHESLFDEAVTGLVKELKSLPVGNPKDDKTLVGPLISYEAVARVQGLINQAVADGWMLTLAHELTGRVLTPSLLVATPDSKPTPAVDEEIFGPVLTVQPYSDIKDLVAKLNASPWGIHASIYSYDLDEVQFVQSELEMSGIIVNGPPTLRFDAMAYGGVKRSGIGREGGTFAMSDYGVPKTTVVSFR